jgi:hypothetical protein
MEWTDLCPLSLQGLCMHLPDLDLRLELRYDLILRIVFIQDRNKKMHILGEKVVVQLPGKWLSGIAVNVIGPAFLAQSSATAVSLAATTLFLKSGCTFASVR